MCLFTRENMNKIKIKKQELDYRKIVNKYEVEAFGKTLFIVTWDSYDSINEDYDSGEEITNMETFDLLSEEQQDEVNDFIGELK